MKRQSGNVRSWTAALKVSVPDQSAEGKETRVGSVTDAGIVSLVTSQVKVNKYKHTVWQYLIIEADIVSLITSQLKVKNDSCAVLQCSFSSS